MSQHTVCVLGAGFSRAISEHLPLPMPLAGDVLKDRWTRNLSFVADPIRGRNWITDPMSPVVLVLTRDIGAYHVPGIGWLHIIDDEPVNYELLYSHCMLKLEDELAKFSEKHVYQEALIQLIHYLSNCLDCTKYESFDAESYSNDFVEAFLKTLEEDAVLFTTNNDNVFWQKRLQPFQQRYQRLYRKASRSESLLGLLTSTDQTTLETWEYGIQPPRTEVVYVHGSINWVTCLDHKCPSYANPYLRSRHQGRYPSFCPICGKTSYPEILAPVSMKSYSSKPLYEKMLRQLWVSLIQARRIVFCGYSFPKLDTLLNSWIMYAIAENATNRTSGRSEFDYDPEHALELVLIRPAKQLEKLLTNICPHNCRLLTYASLQEYIDSYDATHQYFY